jgi:energy-coupling factor transporter ATP-binding protein EcfA2
MKALATYDLTKDYALGFWRPRPYRALDHLTLDVEPGEVFGFLGPNGAGKTTTLKLLMQLVFPTSGEAEILGRLLARMHNVGASKPARHRRKLSAETFVKEPLAYLSEQKTKLTAERATLEGVWTPRPMAWRARVTSGDGPFVAEWRTPSPEGAVRVALVVVPTGGDPLTRRDWRFRPEVLTLTVHGPPRTGGGLAPGDLWPMLVAILLVCGIVAFYRPTSPPRSVV